MPWNQLAVKRSRQNKGDYSHLFLVRGTWLSHVVQGQSLRLGETVRHGAQMSPAELDDSGETRCKSEVLERAHELEQVPRDQLAYHSG